MADAAFDVEVGADIGGAFLHIAQAKARTGGGGIKALTFIGDDKSGLGAGLTEHDGNGGGLTMFEHVVKAFLRDAVKGDLRIGR